MISSFYYLAAYTAAVAAGFSKTDSAAIARAARYTEECAGFTAPAADPTLPEDPTAQLLKLAVFHYLPGDAQEILQEVNPAFLSGPNAAYAPVLSLICRPGGALYRQVIDSVLSALVSKRVSPEQIFQRIGLMCHILTDTYLHQGFAGMDCAPVNGVSAILAAAAPLPYENRRQLLERSQTEPLETLLTMTPVTPDPAAGTTGCGQVEALADCPAAVFSYQSPWAKEPLAACVNPLRCADAYLSLKSTLAYLRSSAAGQSVSLSGVDERQHLDISAFFGGITNEDQLNREWPLFFGWLGPLPTYLPPNSTDDASYLRGFERQALNLRETVWKASPLLRAYAAVLEAGAAPESHKPQSDPDKTDDPTPAQDTKQP